MGRRIIASIVGGCLCLALVALAPPAGASSDETSFVNRINAERTSRGLRALTVKADLVRVSRAHSVDMARARSISHTQNLGSGVSGWTQMGENVGSGKTVDLLHDAFMASASHRSNILHATFNQIGVGIAMADGKIYVTQTFAQRAEATGSRVTRRATAPRVSRSVAVQGVSQPARRATISLPAPIQVVSMLIELAADDAGAPGPRVDPLPPISV